jgi:hypothetical protein
MKTGLKTVGTCDYLQGLLVSNNCEPFQYQEFVEELPSKKAFNNANLFANQMYNTKFEHLYWNNLLFLAAVCKHLPSPEYIDQILETLFLHPKNKWLTLNAIQEVSHRQTLVS